MKTNKEYKIFQEGSIYKVVFVKDAIMTREKLRRIICELAPNIKEKRLPVTFNKKI